MASAASLVSPTDVGNKDVTSIFAGSRPTRCAASANCTRTEAAVRNVLRVRIMPSAISPQSATPFGNTADRYIGTFRCRGVYHNSKFWMRSSHLRGPFPAPLASGSKAGQIELDPENETGG